MKAAASASWLLLIPLGAQAQGMGAPPVHGFVDPCAVSFVQDDSVECESCSTAGRSADACGNELKGEGYERKCRTSGHSEPAEVWCRPKQYRQSRLRKGLIVAALVGSTLLGAAVLLTRRRGNGRRP